MIWCRQATRHYLRRHDDPDPIYVAIWLHWAKRIRKPLMQRSFNYIDNYFCNDRISASVSPRTQQISCVRIIESWLAQKVNDNQVKQKHPYFTVDIMAADVLKI